jgi:predicted phosphodiesterase
MNTKIQAAAGITRVLCMSDIHSATADAVTKLIKRKLVDRHTVVICTGDMAGTGSLGSDADPSV